MYKYVLKCQKINFKDNPESPRDFRVEKVIDQNTLMLAWTPPKYTNNSHSRGVKCTGYKVS